MDTGTLVEMQFDDGKRFVERLVHEGVAVTAAFWVKESESGEWFLYLATPLAGEDGATRAAYRHVNALIRKIQQESFWIDPLALKLIGPNDPVAQAAMALRDQRPARIPTRYQASRLGELAIDEAYLYPGGRAEEPKRP